MMHLLTVPQFCFISSVLLNGSTIAVWGCHKLQKENVFLNNALAYSSPIIFIFSVLLNGSTMVVWGCHKLRKENVFFKRCTCLQFSNYFYFQCPIEWFHYGCVGLSQAPKGKWFCPQCTAAMKRRGRR